MEKSKTGYDNQNSYAHRYFSEKPKKFSEKSKNGYDHQNSLFSAGFLKNRNFGKIEKALSFFYFSEENFRKNRKPAAIFRKNRKFG